MGISTYLRRMDEDNLDRHDVKLPYPETIPIYINRG